MKKLLMIVGVVAVLSGCSYFKGVLKGEKPEKKPEVTAPVVDSVELNKITVVVKPLPLVASGDSIKVNYELTIPKMRFQQGAKLEVIPVLLCAGDTIIGKRAILQGEAVSGENAVVVPLVEGVYKSSCVFPYVKNDYKEVAFYLMMQTVKLKKNMYGAGDMSTKLDTLYVSRGLSVIDRLLIVNELFMVANETATVDTMKIMKMQYAKGDSSRVRIDSIASVMSNNYMRAVADNNIGVVAYQNGDLARAKTKLTESIKEDSTLCQPRFNMALMAIEQGDYDLARTYLNSLQDLQPKKPIYSTLLDYVNGKYMIANTEFSGFNKALIEVLMQDLSAAKNTIAPMTGASSDMLRLIIYAREKDTLKIDTILYQSKTSIEKLKGYHVVENEIEINKL